MELDAEFHSHPQTELRWTPGAAACVVASSAGYPGGYKTGLPITGLEAAAKVPGVHLYILNRASSALALFAKLKEENLLG